MVFRRCGWRLTFYFYQHVEQLVVPEQLIADFQLRIADLLFAARSTVTSHKQPYSGWQSLSLARGKSTAGRATPGSGRKHFRAL